MKCFLLDFDVAISATEVGDQLVVISRDINHASAFARLTQNFLDDIVVLLWPINPATQ